MEERVEKMEMECGTGGTERKLSGRGFGAGSVWYCVLRGSEGKSKNRGERKKKRGLGVTRKVRGGKRGERGKSEREEEKERE
jgi:hypothetical protein